MKNGLDVKSKELYRAKAPRTRGGYRFVRIHQVRSPRGEFPYVLVHEVNAAGETLRGRDRAGFRQSEVFTIFLTALDGCTWRMPASYEKVA